MLGSGRLPALNTGTLDHSRRSGGLASAGLLRERRAPTSLEHGRYIVRVPSSGRMATSTVNDPPIDDNEYYVQDPAGLRKLYHGWPPVPGYAVQNAYGEGKVGPPAHVLERAHVNIEFECLFVGTRSEFSSDGRNCSAWRNGDPEPPQFHKRSILPRPLTPSESRPK
jgi:hypothetical protein